MQLKALAINLRIDSSNIDTHADAQAVEVIARMPIDQIAFASIKAFENNVKKLGWTPSARWGLVFPGILYPPDPSIPQDEPRNKSGERFHAIIGALLGLGVIMRSRLSPWTLVDAMALSVLTLVLAYSYYRLVVKEKRNQLLEMLLCFLAIPGQFVSMHLVVHVFIIIPIFACILFQLTRKWRRSSVLNSEWNILNAMSFRLSPISDRMASLCCLSCGFNLAKQCALQCPECRHVNSYLLPTIKVGGECDGHKTEAYISMNPNWLVFVSSDWRELSIRLLHPS